MVSKGKRYNNAKVGKKVAVVNPNANKPKRLGRKQLNKRKIK